MKFGFMRGIRSLKWHEYDITILHPIDFTNPITRPYLMFLLSPLSLAKIHNTFMQWQVGIWHIKYEVMCMCVNRKRCS